LDISAAVNGAAGLGRYAHALLLGLQAHLRPQIFYNASRARPQDLAPYRHLTGRAVSLGYKPWRMAVLGGQMAGIPFNRLLPPETELFHATEHLLLPLEGIPTVLTVHDLIYKLFPEHHKRLNYWFLNLAMPLFVRRAQALIAISEATRQDLITHYATPPEKIHVIYEAAAPHFQPQTSEKIEAIRQRYQLPERFVLSVGTLEPRKNYTRLLEALQGLRRYHPDLNWVIVGKKGWLYEPFLARLEALQAQSWVQFTGFVADEDLPAVYSAATLTAMPSFYEGFGLPVLEALACACPVVTSNRASLPELGGLAALYVDPEDTEALQSQILRLWTDKTERETRQALGLQQAARFSWEATARATLSVYEGVLGKRLTPP
jgi:glycosyltransferase involved in cell wall biosynthesis